MKLIGGQDSVSDYAKNITSTGQPCLSEGPWYLKNSGSSLKRKALMFSLGNEFRQNISFLSNGLKNFRFFFVTFRKSVIRFLGE